MYIPNISNLNLITRPMMRHSYKSCWCAKINVNYSHTVKKASVAEIDFAASHKISTIEKLSKCHVTTNNLLFPTSEIC